MSGECRAHGVRFNDTNCPACVLVLHAGERDAETRAKVEAEIVAFLRMLALSSATFMDADEPRGNRDITVIADAIERGEYKEKR